VCINSNIQETSFIYESITNYYLRIRHPNDPIMDLNISF